ncbi:MAG: hypothetical protein WAM70_15225 [Pyrinomonadaceae bacterium]
MRQININRNPDGTVTYDEVWIDPTENVFFTNLDPQEAHWPYINPDATSPDFCDNQLGAAPSPNSSQCPVPPPKVPNKKPPPELVNATAPYVVNYTCKFHPNERGTVNVLPQMAGKNTTLPAATVNQPLPASVQVVTGGKSKYSISGQMFQVTDGQGNVIDQGADSIGPGLQLVPDQVNNNGISVSGTPTKSGTYAFTFNVNDGMGGNFQQVQYTMKVS